MLPRTSPATPSSSSGPSTESSAFWSTVTRCSPHGTVTTLFSHTAFDSAPVSREVCRSPHGKTNIQARIGLDSPRDIFASKTALPSPHRSASVTFRRELRTHEGTPCGPSRGPGVGYGGTAVNATACPQW
eukprot:3541363-Rhodomonas_salina.1